MSEEKKGPLEGVVSAWAKQAVGVDNDDHAKVKSCAQGWMQELDAQSVFTLEALEKRAEGPRWASTLEKLSDGLATELDRWYKEKYPKSNPTFQLLCNSSDPFFSR